jgi:hypothetical protein
MRKLTPEKKLILKLTNMGRMNMHEWVEIIVEDYIIEQSIEDLTSLDTIKDKFYMELHNGFMCTNPILLHNFFLDKGIGDIVKFHPRLGTPPQNSHWEERDEKWAKILEERCKDTKQMMQEHRKQSSERGGEGQLESATLIFHILKCFKSLREWILM